MSTSCFPPEQLHNHLSEKLCYVKCTLCQTVLAVSVPCASLFKTVAVRCGHCSNLFSLNMRGVLLPAAPNSQLHFGNSLFPPQNIQEDFLTSPVNQQLALHQQIPTDTPIPFRGMEELPKPPVVNRPPEKRQRVPSAYNRFIKDEIQRIKAGNPDISHREAFSAAAKNWAHFPHIQFGMMPDPAVKKPNAYQQEGDVPIMKDGILPPANNVGVSPY